MARSEQSGVYRSWNSNTCAFESQVSEEAAKLWEVSKKLVGLA
jgi:hypothetical protein